MGLSNNYAQNLSNCLLSKRMETQEKIAVNVAGTASRRHFIQQTLSNNYGQWHHLCVAKNQVLQTGGSGLTFGTGGQNASHQVIVRVYILEESNAPVGFYGYIDRRKNTKR